MEPLYSSYNFNKWWPILKLLNWQINYVHVLRQRKKTGKIYLHLIKFQSVTDAVSGNSKLVYTSLKKMPLAKSKSTVVAYQT